jgi:hypothetical protein
MDSNRRNRGSILWSSCDPSLLMSRQVHPLENPILDEIRQPEIVPDKQVRGNSVQGDAGVKKPL